jgi:hypothetical protein
MVKWILLECLALSSVMGICWSGFEPHTVIEVKLRGTLKKKKDSGVHCLEEHDTFKRQDF